MTEYEQEQELLEQLPRGPDSREMADSVEDELVPRGVELGLDPTLALFAARTNWKKARTSVKVSACCT